MLKKVWLSFDNLILNYYTIFVAQKTETADSTICKDWSLKDFL